MCCVGRARSRLVRAGQRAARGEPRHVLRALTHVAVAGAANKRATLPETHTNKELAEKPLELYIRNLDRIVTSTQGIMCPYATSYKSDTYEPKLKVKKYIKVCNTGFLMLNQYPYLTGSVDHLKWEDTTKELR
ncbi:hypothetical protein HF086_017592 [Spodoptera exigua]|uniref:Uncharacterized protein n=1 Tax=Spodoptera exigua TaxID=7107 RepID=A0A922MJA9_SPOEX|nr:hypothetical protein HF086_017592 [Spodoptera exigua]